MKTLILIFVLFSASLMGQDYKPGEIPISALSDLPENTTIGFYSYPIYNQPYSEPAVTSIDLIRYAKEYKTECYNDSVERCGWVFVQSPYQNSVYISGWDEYKCWYTHKEPTFSDFIDWISLKLNIE